MKPSSSATETPFAQSEMLSEERSRRAAPAAHEHYRVVQVELTRSRGRGSRRFSHTEGGGPLCEVCGLPLASSGGWLVPGTFGWSMVTVVQLLPSWPLVVSGPSRACNRLAGVPARDNGETIWD